MNVSCIIQYNILLVNDARLKISLILNDNPRNDECLEKNNPAFSILTFLFVPTRCFTSIIISADVRSFSAKKKIKRFKFKITQNFYHKIEKSATR